MLTLTVAFFIVALVYATVGFGGGSSYIALLALSGLSHTLTPKISLICNILVVAGGCYHFMRKDHMNRSLILPLILSSVPMAFVGGLYPIKEKTFFTLLTLSLLLCGLRILFVPDKQKEHITTPSGATLVLVGGILGLLSGLVGIGGGIFLSPILINLGWARSKDAAAVASVFILSNSLAGFTGQLIKSPSFPDFGMYLPLFLAVVMGGQIGSRIGTHSKTSYRFVQKSTGTLILIICAQLFRYTA